MRVFNNETAIEYAHHILALAKREIKINNLRTYLVSCAAHTSKRFSKSITQFCSDRNTVIAKDKHRHACLCFSLLLNSRDLEMITTYFKWICTYYLSEYKSDDYILADKQLKEALEIRPELNEDLNSIIHHSFKIFMEEQAKLINVKENLLETSDSNQTKNKEKQQSECVRESCEEDDEIEVLFDENNNEENLMKGKTIRENSPFTSIFENLYEEIVFKIQANIQNDKEANSKYNAKLIHFILKNYMPYCFIWASFSFQDTELTRLTNGLGEKHNEFSKSIGTRMSPSNYADQAITIAKGSALTYQKTLLDNKPKKNKQANKELEDNEDYYHGVETYYKANSGVAKPSYQSSVIYQDYIQPQKKSVKRKNSSSKLLTLTNSSTQSDSSSFLISILYKNLFLNKNFITIKIISLKRK